jgi:hypothetical protein
VPRNQPTTKNKTPLPQGGTRRVDPHKKKAPRKEIGAPRIG